MTDASLLDRFWEALENIKVGQGLDKVFAGLSEQGFCTIKVYDNGTYVTLVNANPQNEANNPTQTMQNMPLIETPIPQETPEKPRRKRKASEVTENENP